MSEIKCPSCGKEISDAFEFCYYCGHKVNERGTKENSIICNCEYKLTPELYNKFNDLLLHRFHKTKLYLPLIIGLILIIEGIFLLFFEQIIISIISILYGLYLSIFPIFKRQLIRRSMDKNRKNNNNEYITISMVFLDDCLLYSDSKTNETARYDNFKDIFLTGDMIIFVNPNKSTGYFAPLNAITEKEELIFILSKLSSFKRI